MRTDLVAQVTMAFSNQDGQYEQIILGARSWKDFEVVKGSDRFYENVYTLEAIHESIIIY